MVKYSLIMAERKWKRFPGNNRFYCNGLLMSANQIGILVFVAIVIIVTGALYFAFEYVANTVSFSVKLMWTSALLFNPLYLQAFAFNP